MREMIRIVEGEGGGRCSLIGRVLVHGELIKKGRDHHRGGLFMTRGGFQGKR